MRKALVLGAAVIAPQFALADMPVTYQDQGRSLFRFDVPDFWVVRTGGQHSVTPPDSDEARLINRVIGMQPSTDDGVWMGFLSPNGVRTYDDAIEYLRDIGPFVVKDAQATSQKTMRIGGLPAASFAGTGRRDGKAVNFNAVLIDLPGNRVAIALVVQEAGSDPAFTNEINQVFASFRAIN
ncbi:MAG: hypothetical protein ACU0AZ_16455 [Paracoccaceae bacterium]